jgi:hypothetical protein
VRKRNRPSFQLSSDHSVIFLSPQLNCSIEDHEETYRSWFLFSSISRAAWKDIIPDIFPEAFDLHIGNKKQYENDSKCSLAAEGCFNDSNPDNDSNTSSPSVIEIRVYYLQQWKA